MILSQLPRRVGQVLPLAAELARVGARTRGVPPAPDLVRLQHASRRAGGIPRLVSEVLVSYTLDQEPSPDAPGEAAWVRAAGRASLPPRGPGGACRSRADADPRLSIDVVLLRPMLVVGLRGDGDRTGFAQSLLHGLLDDAQRNADHASAAANLRQVARAFDEGSVPLRLAPQEGEGSAELAVTVDSPAEATVPEVVAAMGASRLVHGRVAATAPAGSPPWRVTHWECVRHISEPCAALLAALSDPDSATGPGLERAVALGASMGIPPGSARTNLPRLIRLLEPVGAHLAPAGEGPAGEPSGVASVPDAVGLLYGISDLLAARAWRRDVSR